MADSRLIEFFAYETVGVVDPDGILRDYFSKEEAAVKLAEFDRAIQMLPADKITYQLQLKSEESK